MKLNLNLPLLVIAAFLACNSGALANPTLEELRSCTACTIKDTDLSGARLNGLDLGGATLERLNFDRAEMAFMNFDGASLSNVSFRNTRLLAASFVGARLDGVDFTGADLRGAVFDSALFVDVDTTGAVMCNTQLPNDRMSNTGC